MVFTFNRLSRRHLTKVTTEVWRNNLYTRGILKPVTWQYEIPKEKKKTKNQKPSLLLPSSVELQKLHHSCCLAPWGHCMFRNQ